MNKIGFNVEERAPLLVSFLSVFSVYIVLKTRILDDVALRFRLGEVDHMIKKCRSPFDYFWDVKMAQFIAIVFLLLVGAFGLLCYDFFFFIETNHRI